MPLGNTRRGFRETVMFGGLDIRGDIQSPAYLLEEAALLCQAEVLAGNAVREKVARSQNPFLCARLTTRSSGD
jgi:hypothetical protein